MRYKKCIFYQNNQVCTVPMQRGCKEIQCPLHIEFLVDIKIKGDREKTINDKVNNQSKNRTDRSQLFDSYHNDESPNKTDKKERGIEKIKKEFESGTNIYLLARKYGFTSTALKKRLEIIGCEITKPVIHIDKSNDICGMLKDHAVDLNNDSERLSTEFMQKLIGIKCIENTQET